MNTLEEIVAVANEIEAINERNNPKDEKRWLKLTQLSGELARKRLLEIAGNNKLLVAYMKQMNDLGLEPRLKESSASYLMRLNEPANFSWVGKFLAKHKIQKPEEFSRLITEDMRCQLTQYCELFDSPDLSEKIKIEIGQSSLQVYRNMTDIHGLVFTPEIERMLSVIQRRVKELGNKNAGDDLYYWPLKNLSFDNVLNRLKEENFIPEILLARTVFTHFDNKGLTLRWERSKRELMYFLLLLFDGRVYKSETLTEIAFKLFDFESKAAPKARKSFTTDLAVIERDLTSIHEHRSAFKILHDILKQKLESIQV